MVLSFAYCWRIKTVNKKVPSPQRSPFMWSFFHLFLDLLKNHIQFWERKGEENKKLFRKKKKQLFLTLTLYRSAQFWFKKALKSTKSLKPCLETLVYKLIKHGTLEVEDEIVYKLGEVPRLNGWHILTVTKQKGKRGFLKSLKTQGERWQKALN